MNERQVKLEPKARIFIFRRTDCVSQCPRLWLGANGWSCNRADAQEHWGCQFALIAADCNFKIDFCLA